MTKTERKNAEDEILYQVSQVSTNDQYLKTVAMFRAMNDTQFEEFYDHYMGSVEEITSWKEYRKRVDEARKANGVTEENSAMNSVIVQYMSDEANREMWSKINETNPSDLVALKWDDIKQLNRLWHESAPDDQAETPADILLSGSIPLTDVEISFADDDSPYNTYRIVIFKDYQKIIAENKEARVGALIMYIKHVRLALPLYVMDGVNGIVFTDFVAHSGVTDKMIRQSKMPVSMMLKMAMFVMNAWYGVMIALLHPVVKDVFRKGAKQKEKATLTDDAGNRKRIVRYVRRRYVNTDKLVDAITGGGQSRTYHALVWHVVGHWRQLASGKKTFVRPYWKGAMRSLKRNLDEVERQLVLPKEE